MNPDQIAASGSESSHQKALMAWAAMAQANGFEYANDMRMYRTNAPIFEPERYTVPTLRWLHSIPNGGARDGITGARMKAEGLKRGIPDMFLPVARKGCHGLYIEMKKLLTGTISQEQKEFEKHCFAESYAFCYCFSWREAAERIQTYLTGN